MKRKPQTQKQLNNLIHINDRDNAKELQSKGGKKSGEVRQQKKFMRETLNTLLSMPYKEGKIDSIEGQNFLESITKNLSVEEVMLMGQVLSAIKGDTRAATFVRDTSGNKPEEVQQILFANNDDKEITINISKFNNDDWDE